MAEQIPFVVYIRIVPARGSGTREEVVHDRAKSAYFIYKDLEEYGGNTGDEAIVLPLPGGSARFDINSDSLSTTSWGAAVKPQFGEAPDTVTIPGFVTLDDATYTDTYEDSPYQELSIIHSSVSHNAIGNKTITGPGGAIPGWKALQGPTPQNNIAATVLKDTINTVISTGEVIAVEIKGVRYGRGGFHFQP
jgi:hypothetical protein